MERMWYKSTVGALGLKDTSLPGPRIQESSRIRMNRHRPSKIIQMPCTRICDLRRKNTCWYEWNLEVGDLLVLWFVFHKKQLVSPGIFGNSLKGQELEYLPTIILVCFRIGYPRSRAQFHSSPLDMTIKRVASIIFFNGQLMALSEIRESSRSHSTYTSCIWTIRSVVSMKSNGHQGPLQLAAKHRLRAPRWPQPRWRQRTRLVVNQQQLHATSTLIQIYLLSIIGVVNFGGVWLNAQMFIVEIASLRYPKNWETRAYTWKHPSLNVFPLLNSGCIYACTHVPEISTYLNQGPWSKHCPLVNLKNGLSDCSQKGKVI